MRDKELIEAAKASVEVDAIATAVAAERKRCADWLRWYDGKETRRSEAIEAGHHWEGPSQNSAAQPDVQPKGAPGLWGDEQIICVANQAVSEWNAAADQHNQWPALDDHEKALIVGKAIQRAMSTQSPAPAFEDRPACNPHPKAPHGFNRSASHNAGRYVCECEGWDAWDAGYQEGARAALDADDAQAPAPAPAAVRYVDGCNYGGRNCGRSACERECSAPRQKAAQAPAVAQQIPGLTPDQLADKCEAWLQTGTPADNVVDAYEAGYRDCEAAHAAALHVPIQDAKP